MNLNVVMGELLLTSSSIFKLASRSGTGLLQLLRVRPSFLPSFLLCQQFIKYGLVLYDVSQCYQILCAVQDFNPRPQDCQALDHGAVRVI